MAKKAVPATLQEDFEALGITDFDPTMQAVLGGATLEPKTEEPNAQDEDEDPLCAESVNDELFDRIEALPYDKMESEDIDEVLEGLKEKKLPDDASDELKARAEKIVDFLISEAAAKRMRRFKAGDMAKKQSFQCPQGLRQDPKNPRRCIRAAKAVGGAGKLAKEGRKKKRWGKSGAGKKSTRKSERWAARRHEGLVSPFARELGGLLEDANEQQMDVRDEILDRIGNILEMLSEEFLDAAVTDIFIEAYEPIAESWSSGRLDEDVMDEEEFKDMVRPVVALITKSLDRIDSQDRGELGNE